MPKLEIKIETIRLRNYFKVIHELCLKAISIAAVAAILLATPALYGQLETGSILGVIQDSSGAVIGGAHVTVENTLTGAKFDSVTGSKGTYEAPVLPLGVYKITASAGGFKTSVIDGVHLSVGERKRADLTLQLGEATQSITVTSAAPLLQTASSEVGTVIPEQEVKNLPMNGRSIGGLLALLPGTSGANTNWFQSSIGFTVDGTDASQVDSGFVGAAYQSAQRITRSSLDAVQEVQVQTSNFSAEWGQTNGAIFNIVTKSGTNSFHGSAFEYLRNEDTDARYYFNPAPGVKPKDRVNQFGGSLGGPIIRDKVFFFGNYEGIKQLSGATFNDVLVPTEEFRATLPDVLQPIVAEMPLPNQGVFAPEPRLGYFSENVDNKLTENSGSVKIDYQMTQRDKLSVRWNGNQSDTFTYFGVAKGQTRDIPGWLQTARVSYTKIFSPTLYNEASFALNRMRYLPYGSSDPTVRQEPILFTIGSGGTSAGPALFDIKVANTSFTYLDTLSWVKGRNQMKVGLSIVRNQQNKGLGFQRGTTFITLDDFAANRPFFVSTLGYPVTGIRLNYWNGFVQDDLQLTHKLALNMGLRYTYDNSPGEAHNRLENYNPKTGLLDPMGTTVMQMPKDGFGPRFGFAYRPWEAGKTVLRGAVGIFYNDINAAQAQELMANWAGQDRSESIFQNPDLHAYPFPTDLPGSLPNIFGLPKTGWHSPHTYQWNLSVQQELTPSMTFQIAYVGNQTADLSPIVEINPLNSQGLRANPNYGTIQISEPASSANYHGLQLTFHRRMQRHLTFDLNYAWSRSNDYGGEIFGSGEAVQNDHDFAHEYGPADYDQRHYFEGNFTYELPAVPKAPQWLGGGWQVNGIFTAHSGSPYDVTTGQNFSGTGDNSSRPYYVPGVRPIPANKNVPNGPEINIAAFRNPNPAVESPYGNVRRNSFFGPGSVNLDSSLFKNFKLRESLNLQLRVEAFNTFNHPNFSTPVSNMLDGRFGQSLGASGARQLQLAARLDF